MKQVKVKQTKTIEVPGLGQRIREARKQTGKTTEALAQQADISKGYWYDLEKERLRDAIPIETLARIEKVLKTDFGVKFECDQEGDR